MSFVAADNLSLALFEIFSLIMFLLISYSVWKTSERRISFEFFFIAYLVLFSVIVARGLPGQFPLPVIPILFLSVVVFALLLAFSSVGKKIGMAFSMAALVGFQAFRFPLELLLHHWANLGTVPTTMTWTGQNWDIVSGVVALLAIPFANRYRSVAVGAEVVGFVLLLNVVRVVIMSSPLPFAWKLENPMQLILFLPYAWIAPLFVGAALAGHIIAFRVLFGRNS